MPADRDARSRRLPVDAATLSRIARPESIVLLAETVRAAREQLRRERIQDLKQQMSSDDGYTVPSKQLAERVLSAQTPAAGPGTSSAAGPATANEDSPRTPADG